VIHFKCQVPQTVSLQIHIFKSPVFIQVSLPFSFIFTLCLPLLQWQQTPTLPLHLPCVLLSNNDSRHQHCIYLYLVSCSPTMTTDNAFTLLCVSLSYIDTRQIYPFTIFKLLFPSELFCPQSGHRRCLVFITLHSHQHIHNIAFISILQLTLVKNGVLWYLSLFDPSF